MVSIPAVKADRVMAGFEHLRAADVDVNVLCTIHAGNQNHALDVYRFFRDELEVRFIQFIPIVERTTEAMLPIANIGWKTGKEYGELVRSERQIQFGRDKRDTLPEFCRSCEVRFACHGGCPKNRFTNTPDGEDEGKRKVAIRLVSTVTRARRHAGQASSLDFCCWYSLSLMVPSSRNWLSLVNSSATLAPPPLPATERM